MTIDPKDIARIIKVCKNAGIREFELGDLHLKFFESSPQASVPEMTAQDKLQELERTIAADNDLNDLRLQNLMIEDPLRYEEIMRKSANGEIL
jgi:hypothetical protein